MFDSSDGPSFSASIKDGASDFSGNGWSFTPSLGSSSATTSAAVDPSSSSTSATRWGVSNIAPGDTETLTVKAENDYYNTSKANITYTFPSAPSSVELHDITRTADGFYTTINNIASFNNSAGNWLYTPTSTVGHAAAATSKYMVSTLNPGELSTLTVTAKNSYYETVSGSVTGTSLDSQGNIDLSAVSQEKGFKVTINNDVSFFGWDISSSTLNSNIGKVHPPPSPFAKGGTWTVDSLGDGSSTTLQIVLSKSGHVDSSGTVKGTSLKVFDPSQLDLSAASQDASSFTVTINSNAGEFAGWDISSSTLNNIGKVHPPKNTLGTWTVDSLGDGSSTTLQIVLNSPGYVDVSGTVKGRAYKGFPSELSGLSFTTVAVGGVQAGLTFKLNQKVDGLAVAKPFTAETYYYMADLVASTPANAAARFSAITPDNTGFAAGYVYTNMGQIISGSATINGNNAAGYSFKETLPFSGNALPPTIKFGPITKTVSGFYAYLTNESQSQFAFSVPGTTTQRWNFSGLQQPAGTIPIDLPEAAYAKWEFGPMPDSQTFTFIGGASAEGFIDAISGNVTGQNSQ